MELPFSSKTTFAITMFCSSDEILEIVVRDEGFVVVATIYAIVRVFEDGIQIWESYNYIPYPGSHSD